MPPDPASPVPPVPAAVRPAPASFTTTPDGEQGLHYLCPSYKRLVAHVDRPMRFRAGALRAGRPADAVMSWMARADVPVATSD